MRAKRTISLLMALICLVATSAVLRAEQPIITGRFSADSIEVGDRVEYIIEIDKDRATNIGIPDFSGGLSPKQRAEVAKQNTGAAFIVTGTVVLTPDAQQPLELKASKV